MKLPYADSKAGSSREAEIRAILRGVGASAVGFMVDDDADQIIVQFRLKGREITIPVRVGAYAEAWLRENPHTSRSRSTFAQYKQRARQQAYCASWAILHDMIKAQAAMIAAGFQDTDTAFLPHIRLPSGHRLVDALQEANAPLFLPKAQEAS